jgi:dTDP-glucose 4,6-dehydratase
MNNDGNPPSASPPATMVTGGCGFIGGHFVRQLARKSAAPIIVVDKLTYAADRDSLTPLIHAGRVRFVQADICDGDQMHQLMRDYRVRWVVNFAAESHVDRSIDGPDPFIHSNVVGAQRLAEAAFRHWSHLETTERECFRFLQVSTDEVYGSSTGDAPYTENQPYSPTSPYAASKAAADHLVLSYHRTYGLPVLISISANNYGPLQHPEKLIPLMIQRAAQGGELPVYGDGCQQRDWLHVTDHCDALMHILAAGAAGDSYNIATGERIANLQLVREICRIVNTASPHSNGERRIRHVIDRPGHDRCYAIDASKLRETLGWRPQASFDVKLLETVQWYLEHLDWCSVRLEAQERSIDSQVAGNVAGQVVRQRVGLRGT